MCCDKARALTQELPGAQSSGKSRNSAAGPLGPATHLRAVSKCRLQFFFFLAIFKTVKPCNDPRRYSHVPYLN